MRKENITILILLLISFFVGSVSASCGAGETLVEHYWYEDHFDDDATISDWVGDDPDKSNWYISETNSTLEANADNPTWYLSKTDAKYGFGNYSFLIRSISVPSTQWVGGEILQSASNYIDFEIEDDSGDLYEWVTTDANYYDNDDNSVMGPIRNWNWYNITVYESGGTTYLKAYVNNTLVIDETPAESFPTGYIATFPDGVGSQGAIIQYDYISYTNWSCEAESVPPPIITTSIIDPNLVDWRNLSAMISNVPKIIPGILAMVLGILPLVLIGLIIGLVIGLFGDIIDIMKNLSQYFK